jgi:3'(2'), 5'-bisphosphate nucleotidase
MKPMNRMTRIALALRAAAAAGDEILDVYAGDFVVDRKADASPLTEADRRAQAMIAGMLGPAGVPQLSEEGRAIPFEERRIWPLLWIVDPLDGTKEFVKRNGEFTVNIALVRDGRPVLGIVYAPAADVLYLGEERLGGFKLAADRALLRAMVSEEESAVERFIRLAEKMPFARGADRPFTVVASRSHRTPETEAFIEELRRDHADLELTSIGSSLKLCLVAEGTADIYPRFAPTMEWDTAAGQAVAEASGARVVSASAGTPLVYNKPDLANPWFIVRR